MSKLIIINYTKGDAIKIKIKVKPKMTSREIIRLLKEVCKRDDFDIDTPPYFI